MSTACPLLSGDGGPEAAAAARAADTTENTLYLDPILKGRYPRMEESDVAMATGLEAAVRTRDLAEIAAPVDFLGVNYYSPVVVDGAGRPVQLYPVSAAGWQQIYPEGLAHTLGRLHQDYASPEVMITENGLPDDVIDANDPAAYNTRVAFLRQHLAAVHRAIADGSRVTGFHAWSLLDNFEWAAGYTQRWGLVGVDFDTQERRPKASAAWYSTVSRSNRITAE